MKRDNFMVGIAAGISTLSVAEKNLIQDAGIGWLRSGGLGFDPGRFLSGQEQAGKIHVLKDKIAGLVADGFNIMGLTPGPREMGELAGRPGSPEYFDNYRRVCAALAREFKGLINHWQVANELDIWIFRRSLSLDQSVDFLKAGIRGLKETDSALKVGINITLFPSLPGEVDGNTESHEGVHIAKGIYHDPGLELDYAGFDSYPGTWRKGGVESWDEYLDAFHELTGKPIIVQEFGYSAEGQMMSRSEDESGIYPCEARKWRFSWNGAGHTPETQARFIEESFKVFARKPFVIGATYYNWKDSDECWQCGKSDCPIETAWGLMDRHGNLKPAYYSLKASVKENFGNAAVNCMT